MKRVKETILMLLVVFSLGLSVTVSAQNEQNDDQKRPPKERPPVREPKPKEKPPKGQDRPKKPGMSYYLVSEAADNKVG